MSGLPAFMSELALGELPISDVPDADYDLAAAASYFEWKRRGLPWPETFGLRWFDPAVDAKYLGVFDPEKRTIWLSRDLIGNPNELLKTIGHEIGHAAQMANGLPYEPEEAEAAEELLLKAWTQRSEELEAKRRILRPPLPGGAGADVFELDDDVPAGHPFYTQSLRASPPTPAGWSL